MLLRSRLIDWVSVGNPFTLLYLYLREKMLRIASLELCLPLCFDTCSGCHSTEILQGFMTAFLKYCREGQGVILVLPYILDLRIAFVKAWNALCKEQTSSISRTATYGTNKRRQSRETNAYFAECTTCFNTTHSIHSHDHLCAPPKQAMVYLYSSSLSPLTHSAVHFSHVLR